MCGGGRFGWTDGPRRGQSPFRCGCPARMLGRATDGASIDRSIDRLGRSTSGTAAAGPIGLIARPDRLTPPQYPCIRTCTRRRVRPQPAEAKGGHAPAAAVPSAHAEPEPSLSHYSHPSLLSPPSFLHKAQVTMASTAVMPPADAEHARRFSLESIKVRICGGGGGTHMHVYVYTVNEEGLVSYLDPYIHTIPYICVGHLTPPQIHPKQT